MPLALGTAHTDTCTITGCDQFGHASCLILQSHYNRLVAAAQLYVADHPAEAHSLALAAILNENTPVSGIN